MYSCQILHKNVTNINCCYRLSTFGQLMLCNKPLSIKVPLKYSKILNISIGKYSGQEWPPLPPPTGGGGGGGGEISCFPVFEKTEEISFDTKKDSHGKIQRVSKNQISKHEDLTFTIRNNLVHWG